MYNLRVDVFSLVSNRTFCNHLVQYKILHLSNMKCLKSLYGWIVHIGFISSRILLHFNALATHICMSTSVNRINSCWFEWNTLTHITYVTEPVKPHWVGSQFKNFACQTISKYWIMYEMICRNCRRDPPLFWQSVTSSLYCVEYCANANMV